MFKEEPPLQGQSRNGWWQGVAGERSIANGRLLQERHGDHSCRMGHLVDLQLEAPEPADVNSKQLRIKVPWA